MESIIESLGKLGLTRYEAKAYIGICKLISAPAEQIAKSAEMPRSKVYNTLKELDKKGFVTVTHTRPLEYKAVPPSDVMKRKKDELMKELEDSQEKLDELYNDQLSEIEAPVWLIKTSENIINKEVELIRRSSKSINMRIGFLLEGEGEALIKAFKEIPRNIPIKILACRECYINKEKIEIIKMFEDAKLDNLEIIEADIHFVKIVIRDGKELFRTIVKFTGEEKSVLPETSVGVLNQYKDICKNFDDRFLIQFEKKKAKMNKKAKIKEKS
ncbi:MAG: TrmB family transcriptional regulator [Methanobrevibacter sp.]|nr:TrmB family transcriptional regulator [Methanobrevibacter sp.]